MQPQWELEIITETELDWDGISEIWKSLGSKIKVFSELEGTGQKKIGELLRKHSAERETFSGI